MLRTFTHCFAIFPCHIRFKVNATLRTRKLCKFSWYFLRALLQVVSPFLYLSCIYPKALIFFSEILVLLLSLLSGSSSRSLFVSLFFLSPQQCSSLCPGEYKYILNNTRNLHFFHSRYYVLNPLLNHRTDNEVVVYVSCNILRIQVHYLLTSSHVSISSTSLPHCILFQSLSFR